MRILIVSAALLAVVAPVCAGEKSHVRRVTRDCIQDDRTTYSQIDMPNGVRIQGFDICDKVVAVGMGRQGSVPVPIEIHNSYSFR